MFIEILEDSGPLLINADRIDMISNGTDSSETYTEIIMHGRGNIKFRDHSHDYDWWKLILTEDKEALEKARFRE